jgi:tripartite motif-containing protein 71
MDDSKCNIYVANKHNHHLQKYDNYINFITMCRSEGTGDHQFIEPISVTVDPEDNIYVIDMRAQRFCSIFFFF